MSASPKNLRSCLSGSKTQAKPPSHNKIHPQRSKPPHGATRTARATVKPRPPCSPANKIQTEPPETKKSLLPFGQQPWANKPCANKRKTNPLCSLSWMLQPYQI